MGYLTRCNTCGLTTSKAFAKKNSGRCKSCVTGISRYTQERGYVPTREQVIIDHGYQVYAAEEGHYA